MTSRWLMWACNKKVPLGYQPFFETNEVVGGNFFFKKYSFNMSFSCDDYDEFKENREKMDDILRRLVKSAR
jgi:hypothetical protein